MTTPPTPQPNTDYQAGPAELDLTRSAAAMRRLRNNAGARLGDSTPAEAATEAARRCQAGEQLQARARTGFLGQRIDAALDAILAYAESIRLASLARTADEEARLTWGDLGDLAQAADGLREVAQSLTGRGEYSPER